MSAEVIVYYSEDTRTVNTCYLFVHFNMRCANTVTIINSFGLKFETKYFSLLFNAVINFFPAVNGITTSCGLVLDVSGSPNHHFLQFGHLPLLLCWYHAADN